MASTVTGPTSRIISSGATASAGDGAGLRPRLELGGHDHVVGQQDRDVALASALAMISRAVAARSCSHKDLPTLVPCALRKVLAMPPPMISTSTRSRTWPSTSSLLDTLAPPITAAVGRSAPPSAASSASSSACISRPA